MIRAKQLKAAMRKVPDGSLVLLYNDKVTFLMPKHRIEDRHAVGRIHSCDEGNCRKCRTARFLPTRFGTDET